MHVIVESFNVRLREKLVVLLEVAKNNDAFSFRTKFSLATQRSMSENEK